MRLDKNKNSNLTGVRKAFGTCTMNLDKSQMIVTSDMVAKKATTYVDYFDEIVEEMKDIHKKKNADYGNNFHKRFEKWGFLTALLRLSDKMERLENIYEKGDIQVKDESVYDTLIDLANYAVMTAVEIRNNNKIIR
jgi:deoxyadenosine/deoxycytidine kinase